MSHYNEMRVIHNRMTQIAAQDNVSPTDQAEFERLADQFDDHAAADRNERKAALTGSGYRRAGGAEGTPDHYGERFDPYADERDHRPNDPLRSLRDGALRAVDKRVSDGSLPDHGAENIEKLLGTGTPASRSWAARWAAVTSSDDYVRAFAETLIDPNTAHLRWSPREAEAFQQAEQLRGEMRAMSLTDNLGGYMVPAHLDPSILLSSSGSQSPLRQIARVETITTEAWNGVTSQGVTAEWIAEAAESADASPTLSQPSVPVYKADAFVPFSIELAGDALNFMQELGKLLVDGADQLNSTAYTTGSGTGQPKGVVTSIAAAGGSSVVAPTTAETFTSPDLYKVQNAAAPRFQANASWMMNLFFINASRQFESANGARLFPELSQTPPQLLSRPVYENSGMDPAINPAATESNYVALYGDFKQFLIVDRVPSTLEVVQHLVGPNRRPTGQRGGYLWYRTGSDVLVPNAFRLLSIPTTA